MIDLHFLFIGFQLLNELLQVEYFLWFVVRHLEWAYLIQLYLLLNLLRLDLFVRLIFRWCLFCLFFTWLRPEVILRWYQLKWTFLRRAPHLMFILLTSLLLHLTLFLYFFYFCLLLLIQHFPRHASGYLKLRFLPPQAQLYIMLIQLHCPFPEPSTHRHHFFPFRNKFFSLFGLPDLVHGVQLESRLVPKGILALWPIFELFLWGRWLFLYQAILQVWVDYFLSLHLLCVLLASFLSFSSQQGISVLHLLDFFDLLKFK